MTRASRLMRSWDNERYTNRGSEGVDEALEHDRRREVTAGGKLECAIFESKYLIKQRRERKKNWRTQLWKLRTFGVVKNGTWEFIFVVVANNFDVGGGVEDRKKMEDFNEIFLFWIMTEIIIRIKPPPESRRRRPPPLLGHVYSSPGFFVSLKARVVKEASDFFYSSFPPFSSSSP